MAEQVLEQVLLVLNAKVDGFEAAMKEAAKATKDSAEKMKESAGKMTSGIENAASSFNEFKNKVLVLAGVGGIGALVKSTFEAADELGALATRTGVSTKFLQEMQYAASQLNVDQQVLNQSLQIFTRTIGQAAVGEDTSAKAFKNLGISIFDSSNHLKSAEVLFGEVSDKFSDIESDSVKASRATDLFGKQGIQMTAILNRGSAELAVFAQEAQNLGLVLDDRLIKAADATNDKMATLSRVIKAQLSTAIIELAPLLSGMSDSLLAGSQLTKGFADNVGSWIRAFSRTETIADQIKNVQKYLQFLYDTKAPIDDIERTEKALDSLNKQYFKSTDAINSKNQADKEQIQNAKKLEELQTKANEIVKSSQESNAGAKANKELGILEDLRQKKGKLNDDEQQAFIATQDAQVAYAEDLNAKEIDRMMKRNEDMAGLTDQASLAEVEANKASIKQITDAHLVSSDKINEVRTKDDQDEDTKRKKRQKGQMDTLNAVASLQNSKVKELAVVGKAAAIVQATISTYQGAALALATVPFPFGFVAAAAIVAGGLANVAQIAGVGVATGADSIPGLSLTDSVSAVLQPGERVIKTDTNKVLEQFLRDYRDGDSGPSGGAVSIELKMSDNFMDMIETNLVSRGRVQVSNLAA